MQALRQLVREIPKPPSFFSGVAIEHSLAPDNIIFFQRRDSAAMRPVGITANFHHRFELVVVLDTAAPVRIDRVTYALQPGECALIFPNQFHHYLDIAESHMEWLFITFELQSAEAIAALRDSPRVLDTRSVELLNDLTQAFMAKAMNGLDTLEISYLLSRLLLHLDTCQPLPAERRDIHSSDDVRDVILERINGYVRAHLNKSLTIADIAADLDYSVSHLRAVFRDRLGVSLGRYMRTSRLSEAAQLLQKSEFNIGAIGEKCGFESLYAFSRAFRKTYGIPPRAYRQVVHEGAPLPQTELNGK